MFGAHERATVAEHRADIGQSCRIVPGPAPSFSRARQNSMNAGVFSSIRRRGPNSERLRLGPAKALRCKKLIAVRRRDFGERDPAPGVDCLALVDLGLYIARPGRRVGAYRECLGQGAYGPCAGPERASAALVLR
jgi:hypothetical protein